MDRQVTLIRDYYGEQGTIGRLIVGGKVFHTIEEPWKQNQQSISCIPEGEYNVVPHNWEGSSKFIWSKVWRIEDVPGREGILIHNGNTINDIEGCILVGERPGVLHGLPAVLDSRNAIGYLRRHIGNSSFKLTIKRANINQG